MCEDGTGKLAVVAGTATDLHCRGTRSCRADNPERDLDLGDERGR